jgi:hypothetical protein
MFNRLKPSVTSGSNKIFKKIDNDSELSGIFNAAFNDRGRLEKELNDSCKPSGSRKRVRKYPAPVAPEKNI